MAKVKYWEVDTDSIYFQCMEEPERIQDYYKLITIEEKIFHLMIKDLSYISWKPIFK